MEVPHACVASSVSSAVAVTVVVGRLQNPYSSSRPEPVALLTSGGGSPVCMLAFRFALFAGPLTRPGGTGFLSPPSETNPDSPASWGQRLQVQRDQLHITGSCPCDTSEALTAMPCPFHADHSQQRHNRVTLSVLVKGMSDHT